MALDSAQSMSDPFPFGEKLEHVPDSTSLRVSTNTLLESGIPPARVRQELALEGGEERLELAIAGVSRTEANLGQLVRGLKHLAAGALAAREANTELMHELDELRAHLVHTNEEEAALRYRMAQLEQLLDVIRHESERERKFLIEQQDLFLVQILTDHDRQIADLRRTILDAAGRKTHAPEVAELIAQRDQAREYATRCERERDLAWQELAGHAATLPPTPPPTPTPAPTSDVKSPRKSGAAAIGTITLKTMLAAQAPDTERQPSGYSISGGDVPE